MTETATGATDRAGAGESDGGVSIDRLPADLDRIEQALLGALAALEPGTSRARLSPATATELFEAQVGSRLVDHTARWLRAEHRAGYYTIASAGHESNAAVAMALRPTDPALLHYRSGGFYFARAGQVPDQDPTGDVLRGMLALTTDQMSGGRHKVFGNKNLSIIPQTSTISSHPPRAVGLALSIGWAQRTSRSVRSEPRNRGLERTEGPGGGRWPEDSVVVCSFGDASLNHSTAQGALNWALNAAYRGDRVPVLFVCEDNGLGISVPSPDGWVDATTRGRPGLQRADADGANPADVLEAATDLAEAVRARGVPGLLHLRTVRFLGHAGTDVETAYRRPEELRHDLARDPIVGTAAEIVASGVCTGRDLVDWYLDERRAVRDRALDLWDDLDEAELTSADEIVTPLLAPLRKAAGPSPTAVRIIDAGAVQAAGDKRDKPLTLAQTINHTLDSVLRLHTNTMIFGEDVGRKGGVYGVTRGLQARHGADRVFDTILDEQSILGLALGSSLNGYLPMPEIQYLAYLHNAADQLRGEASSLGFFSNGQYRNPMVVRIASYAYQRGFGGHFHNDNSVAALRDIPGIVIASPAHPADAGPMLAHCVAAGLDHGTVSVFLEPIALYHTTHLHFDGDEAWTCAPVSTPAPVGTARTHGDGADGTILTWGNGLYLSLQAAHQLQAHHNRHWRVVDLRWLAPLPVDDIMRESEATGRVLVVDETRHSGGVGEGVVTALAEHGYRGALGRIAARDSFVPLGAAADLVLVGKDQIVAAALDLSGS